MDKARSRQEWQLWTGGMDNGQTSPWEGRGGERKRLEKPRGRVLGVGQLGKRENEGESDDKNHRERKQLPKIKLLFLFRQKNAKKDFRNRLKYFLFLNSILI